MRFRITRTVVCIILVQMMLMGFMPMMKCTSSADGVFVPSRRTIVVNASGGGDYTKIQWAIENASNGDTIFVEAGTYRENLVIYKSISLIGEGAEYTVIDGKEKDDVVFIVANSVNISGFTIMNGINGPFGAGIHLWYAHHCTVNNNLCINNRAGVMVDRDCSGNIIMNNTCYNNLNGIDLHSVNDLEWRDYRNSIIDNNCYNNTYNYFIYEPRETLSECKGNLADGEPVVFLRNRMNHVITEPASMVILINCSNITVRNIIARNNSHGIYCYEGSNNQIIDNTLEYNLNAGIHLGFNSMTSINNNRCNSNRLGDGIRMEYSDNCTLNNNIFMNNNGGIYLRGNDNTVMLNKCNDNNDSGLISEHSSNNVIKNNLFYMNNGSGILINGYRYNVIENNTCLFNTNNGIEVGIGNSLISNNDCSHNLNFGIYHRGYGNRINNNSCTNNNKGLFVFTNDGKNIVRNNLISSNSESGLYLYGCNNEISCNTLQSNADFGLVIPKYDSIDNIIHHNNFFHNNRGEIQASDNGRDNVWNTDSGGNYWSDMVRIDIDKDGIVDQAYVLEGQGDSMDRLPLVNPVGIPLLKAYAGKDILIEQYESFNFDSSGCSASPYVINFSWSFHYDGMLHHLFGPSPNFTFSIPGNYSITLRVVDKFDRIDEDIVNVTVMDVTRPRAYAGPDQIVNQYQLLTFDGSDSMDNVGISEYIWSFKYNGTNITLSGETSSFRFDNVGEYPVTLNVTDAAGNWAIDTINVTVLDITPPVAGAGNDITTFVGETVLLNASGSSDNVGIVNYTWSLTFGGTDIELYGDSSSFVFAQPGLYIVTLTVYDRTGNFGRDTLSVLVNAEPTPLDSDYDGYPDEEEMMAGSDPFDPLSTPLDIDGDTFNNTFENASGSDPLNSTSIPSDRDGDGHPNDEDAYPDDPARWEREVEDDDPPDDEDEDGTGGGIGARYVWAGVSLAGVLIVGVIVFVHVWRGRKGDIRDVEGDVDVDGEGDEEKLGRVRAEGDDE